MYLTWNWKKRQDKTKINDRRDMHYIGIKNDRQSSAQKNVEYVKRSGVIPNFFQVPWNTKTRGHIDTLSIFTIEM